MRRPLSQEELAAGLDRWVGQEVSVRVVTQATELVAVFRGVLQTRSDEKRPALFWPLSVAEQAAPPEKPGVLLHPELFEAAVAREGGFVLELRQDGVTLNLRRT